MPTHTNTLTRTKHTTQNQICEQGESKTLKQVDTQSDFPIE